ncbi:tyrosine-protein kinase Mer-like isoform X3 [Dysidea avara]|uniref:tyrosine-protein kinase Mer-like isoform X3 n=1 Tax=Dysidea avara TaxID=196820 RepID=UPI0033205C28
MSLTSPFYGGLESSLIDCSVYSDQPLFTYSNETIQNDAIKLLESLSNITNGKYCIVMLNRFLCNIIFPPFQQSSTVTQTLCTDSCENYVSNGICARHVKAMIERLRTMSMNETALGLQNCTSPLLEPNNGTLSEPNNGTSSNCTTLPVLHNSLDFVQCNPLPDQLDDAIEGRSCQGLLIYDAYTIDISSRPDVIEITNEFRIALKNISGDDICSIFLTYIVCSLLYHPCSNDTFKLLPICMSSCHTVKDVIAECINVVLSIGLHASIRFNCEEPSSYIPGVELPRRLFDEDNCLLFSNAVGSSPNSPSNSFPVEIVAVVVPILALVGIAIIVASVVIWKYMRNKRIVVNAGRLSLNPLYGIYSTSNSQSTSLLTDTDAKRNFVVEVSECDDINQLIIPEQEIIITAELGEGEFGSVFKGEWQYTNSAGVKIAEEVAVKTLKGDYTSAKSLKTFLHESAIMKNFKHPNVLSVFGVCLETSDGVPFIVLPYMPNGDLRNYLKSRRRDESNVEQFPIDIGQNRLVDICYKIACGMSYLAKKRIVHRDLAARNCMVDKSLQIKVADFGLARDVYMSEYYRHQNATKLPVKWMAPEALNDRKSDEKTDVWSYGVTCWEVFSLGRSPYPTVGNNEILQHIEAGNRLQMPALCSEEMYLLMLKCWDKDGYRRVCFEDIVLELKQMMAVQATQYQPYATIIENYDT